MILEINSIREVVFNENPVIKSRVFGNNNINYYRLVEPLDILLTTGDIIVVPKDFVWDLASSPKIIHNIISSDSDAELAFLIHDYLYRTKFLSKEKSDKEMLLWSIALNGTQRWSFKNIDNYLRYWAVKLFGRKSYNTKRT